MALYGQVWGLWLASLCVGYALILVSIIRTLLPAHADAPPPPRGWENAPVGRGFSFQGILLALFLLAFFTFHFGGFHYGHSIFLNIFFPIAGATDLNATRLPDAADYLTVFKQSGWFVPLAFIAQRAAFRATPPGRRTHPLESGMLAPYKNVVRLHLLIFFFAFAHFLRLPGPLVYIVVYVVYFLPFGLLKKSPA